MDINVNYLAAFPWVNVSPWFLISKYYRYTLIAVHIYLTLKFASALALRSGN